MPQPTPATTFLVPGLYDESAFKGLNLFTDFGNMRVGELLVADNYDVDEAFPYTLIEGESPYGVRGGALLSRSGISGQLAQGNRLSNPLFAPLPYMTGTATDVLLASGSLSATSGGKVYKYAQGTTSLTEVKIGGTTSFNLNTLATRMVRQGQFAYIIGNADGKLYRTDLTSAGTSATPSVAAPSSAPTVALTSLVIDALSSAGGWSSDTFSGAGTSDANQFQTTLQNGINGTSRGNISSPITYSGATCWNPDATSPSVLPADGTAGLPATYAALTDGNGVNLVHWFALDDPGGGFYTRDETGSTAHAFESPQLSSPNADRYCCQFYTKFFYYTSDTRSKQAFSLQMYAYSVTNPTFGVTTPLAVNVKSFLPPYSGQQPGQYWDGVFDFPNTTSPVLSVIFYICGGPNNVNAAQFPNFQGFCYAAGFTIAPIPNSITFTEAIGGGLTLTHNEPTSGYWGAIGGCVCTKSYGSGDVQNWSGYDTLLLPLVPSAGGLSLQGFQSAGLSAILDFRDAISGTHYQSNPVTVASDGTYFQVDVTTIPASILSSIEYFEIIFTSDLSNVTLNGYPSMSVSTAGMFGIADISTSGNLSSVSAIGGQSYGPVYYLITAINANGDETLVNIIESDGSSPSAPLQPTVLAAIGQISIGTQPTDPTITHYSVYRFGGVWIDGYGRLIATVPINADITAPYLYTDLVVQSTASQVTSSLRPFVSGDVGKYILQTGGTGFNDDQFPITAVSGGVATYGTGIINGYTTAGTSGSTGGSAQFGGDQNGRDNYNPYVSWIYNTTTQYGVLTDNTPDSFIQNVAIYQQGRQSPPTNATAIATYQGSICLGVGSTLWVSWKVQADIEAGLYFTDIDLGTDPYLSLKGFTYTIAGADNDPIVAMIPAPTGGLLILKNYSVWLLSGTDPTNYAVYPVSCPTLQQAGAMGVGCVAPLAVATNVLTNEVYFLASNGIWKYSNGSLSYMSLDLRGVLDSAYINNPGLYSQISMACHDMKIYVFAPLNGSSPNNVIVYVYDMLLDVWTRYTNYAFTSAVSLTAATDTNSIFMMGYDGQVYTRDGWSDVAYPGATPIPITCIMQTRGLGRDGQGLGRYAVTQPEQVYVAFVTEETNVPISVSVGPLTPSGALGLSTWTSTPFNYPDIAIDVYTHDVSSAARGQLVAVQVTVQTNNAQFKLQSIALQCAEGTTGS